MKNLMKAAALAILCVIGMTSAQADFPEDEKKRAVELLIQLDGDNFAEREAAKNELEQLPFSAVPWLEERIAETPITDIEFRSRLKSIVRSVSKREAELVLRQGSSVKIDLEKAKPEDVLKVLNSELEVSLSSVRSSSIWSSDDAKPFKFEGNYWGAVEKMLETFPPKEAEGREDLAKNQSSSRWIQEDFQAADSPRTSTGIFHVRHGRMALENSGGKDVVVLHLIPTVEPRYQADEVSILVKGLRFPDGTLLEAEDKVAGGTVDRYNRTKIYSWIFPVEKGTKLGKTATIEGSVKLKVRRIKWSEIPLPEEIGEAVKITSTVSLKVLEREEGKLRIEFEGEGRQPDCFNDYQLRSKSYKILDEEGEELKFSVGGSSSGGGKGWKNSYSGSIKGEPKRIRARLPTEEQELQLKFELNEVPMPGSSLLMTAVEPGKKVSEFEDILMIEIAKDGVITLDGNKMSKEDLRVELKKRKEAVGEKLRAVLSADDEGKTQAFVDVIDALAGVGVTSITMTGFRTGEPEKPLKADAPAGGNKKIVELLKKNEDELMLELPRARAAVGERDVGEIVVSITKEGVISIEGKVITKAELEDKLSLIAKVNNDQSVILRGDKATSFDEIVGVLNVCQKAGIWNVAFATSRETKE